MAYQDPDVLPMGASAGGKPIKTPKPYAQAVPQTPAKAEPIRTPMGAIANPRELRQMELDRGYDIKPLALPADTGPAPDRVRSMLPDKVGAEGNYDFGSPAQPTEALPRHPNAPEITGGVLGKSVEFNIGAGHGSVSSSDSAGMQRITAGLADPTRMHGVSAMPDDQTALSTTKMAAHERGMKALRAGQDYQSAYDSIANPGALPQQPNAGFDLGALWQKANSPINTKADIGSMMSQIEGRKQAMALLGQLVQNHGQLGVADAQGQNALQREKLQGDYGLQQTDMQQKGAGDRTQMMADVSRYNADRDYDAALQGHQATAQNQALTRQDSQRKDFRKSAAAQMYVGLLEKNPNDPVLQTLSDVDPKSGKMVPNEYKIQAYFDRITGSDPAAAQRAGMDPLGPTNVVQAAHTANAIQPHKPAIDRPWYDLTGTDQDYQHGSVQYAGLPEAGSAPVDPRKEALQPPYRQNVRNAGQ